MDKKDFLFEKLDTSDGHRDFWFKITGTSRSTLEGNLAETGFRAVLRCVYSQDEDFVAVERIFVFNRDVILYEDNELKEILKSLAEELS